MKRTLIALAVMASSLSFSEAINVKLKPLNNIGLNVSPEIEITSIGIYLSCRWNPTLLQYITKGHYTHTGIAKAKIVGQFRLSSHSTLSINESRPGVVKKDCLAVFRMKVQSHKYVVYRDYFSTLIPLKAEGDLNQQLSDILHEKTFTPLNYLSGNNELVLRRVVLQ